MANMMKSTTAIVIGLMAAFSVSAETSPPVNTNVQYEMKSGDTLLRLVAKYFKHPSAIREIATLNQLKDINTIPVGKKLLFPRQLVQAQTTKANVTSLDCVDAVKVNGESRSIKLGEGLNQGDTIETPKGCQVVLTLDDRSTLALLSGTLIKIKTLLKNPLEKSPEVEVDLLNGRVEVDVPKRPAADAPFQVRTPSSLAGVRGTKFRVGFDADVRDGQVEVKQGNVAAKGSVDDAAKAITDNKGVAIASTGLAGEVEVLPSAPHFLAYNKIKSTTGFDLKFASVEPELKYALAKSADANLVTMTDLGRFDDPQVQADQMRETATFYQWTSISKTGLFGNPKRYAFCAPQQTKKSFCDVNFNMRGMQQVHLHIQRINPVSKAPQDIVNSNFTITDNDQFLLKYLPVGQYQWQIDYEINGGIKSRSSGDFELIAIASE
jgi:hypothetical protein